VMIHQNGLAQHLAQTLYARGDKAPLLILTGHDHQQHVDLYGPNPGIVVADAFVGGGGQADLVRTDGVGPNMAKEIAHFFSGQGGELVDRLLAAGVRPQAAEAVGEGPFTGKTFVFTGTLDNISRPDAEALVRRLGGKAASSVSAKTDYVVAGPGAGSKLEKAQKLKLKILDEAEFQKLLPK